MADMNDRHQGSDHDLFDETAPRSIFAATWFRAVLVLIVLGVIGAVAVPYILDAMNAPKPSATAKLPTPIPPSKPPTPPVAAAPPAPATAPPMTATTPPGAPPTAATPSLSTAPPSSVPATPPPPMLTEKPGDTKPGDVKGSEAKLSDPKLSDVKLNEIKDAMVAATTTPEPAKAEPKAKPAVKTAKATGGRQWFVQVGAFKDAATAKKVATKLREEKYNVDESLRNGGAATVAKATVTSSTSASSPSGTGDQYDVFITGQPPAEITKRLAPKGLTAEASGNGAVVKPSLPLRDAVALSKDLAVDGLKVQVRRAGAGPAATPRASSGAATSTGADTLHRVSVGGFPDRATAMATLKELEAKGYKPFLTRR